MGGGVGGVLYAEDADCGALKYKHYNLRGTLRTCFAIDKCFGNCIVKQNILNGAHYLNCGMLKWERISLNGYTQTDKFLNNTNYMGNEFIILIFYMWSDFCLFYYIISILSFYVWDFIRSSSILSLPFFYIFNS